MNLFNKQNLGKHLIVSIIVGIIGTFIISLYGSDTSFGLYLKVTDHFITPGNHKQLVALRNSLLNIYPERILKPANSGNYPVFNLELDKADWKSLLAQQEAAILNGISLKKDKQYKTGAIDGDSVSVRPQVML